jgi:hypothetical protein
MKVLEIGNSESGCVKIGSQQTNTQVPMKKWFHVFVSLVNTEEVRLYLDSKLVAFSTSKSRQMETSTSLRFGQYPDGSFAIGSGSNMSNLVFIYGLKHVEVDHIQKLSQITLNSGERDTIGNGHIENSPQSVKNQLVYLIDEMKNNIANMNKLDAAAQRDNDVVTYPGAHDSSNHHHHGSIVRAMFYPLNEGLKEQFALDLINVGGGDGVQVKGEYHRGWQPGGRASGGASGGGGASGSSFNGKFKLGLDPFFSASNSKETSDQFGRSNAQLVRNAMKHAWSGYKKHGILIIIFSLLLSLLLLLLLLLLCFVFVSFALFLSF